MFFPKHLKQHIELNDGKMVRVYDGEGKFIAIYKFIKEKYLFNWIYQKRRNFNSSFKNNKKNIHNVISSEFLVQMMDQLFK